MLKSLLQMILSLFGRGSLPSTPAPVPAGPEVPASGDPKWLKLARGELGVKESPGAANNPVVLNYYRDAGHPEVDADSVAWCAAFAGAMLERSGVPCSKQLNARSYLTWGKPVAKPYPGCVAVFSRGDVRSWEGHVGFYLGENGGNITVLGGNQGDAVTIAAQPKSRLLGYREPVKASNSRTLKAQTAGLLLGDGLTIASITGKGVMESLPDALAIGDSVTSLASYWPYAALLGITISILARMVTIWARLDTWATKGA